MLHLALQTSSLLTIIVGVNRAERHLDLFLTLLWYDYKLWGLVFDFYRLDIIVLTWGLHGKSIPDTKCPTSLLSVANRIVLLRHARSDTSVNDSC